MVINRGGVCEKCGHGGTIYHSGRRWLCSDCWVRLFKRLPEEMA